ncbi:MAG: serine/threonine-protein kinase [Kiritimatiellia bacterium]
MQEEQMIPTPSDFGHFLLEKELGHGGMGGVYLARDKMLDRKVGIKVLLKSLGEDPKFVERFQREAQAVARLNHPNIAQVYSFGQENGMPYIAMELVSGGSLDREMEANPGTMDVVRVMRIGQQMADALALAAEQGLVHGDVKPENILFDTDGSAKLVDFGLAAMQGDSNEIWGTPYYISPEKVRRQKIDYRADIYSLGGTLYHALTGVPPWDGADSTAVVKARFEAPPPKPSEIRPDLPKEVDSIIMRMLELEPSMRYPTYTSLLGDFKRFLAKAGPEKRQSTSIGTKIKIRGRTTRTHLSAETGVTPAVLGDDVAELTPVEDEDAKKPLNVGAVVGMVVGGVVLLILLVVGGLMWYVHAEKAREEREHMQEIVAKQTLARTAIQNTLKAVGDFGNNFHELVAKNDKDMETAVRELKRAIPDELRDAVADMIEPPPTKDIAEAIAYTNELHLAAVATAAAEANQAAADAKATAEASQTATNAPAAATTNAAPAATTNAAPAAAANAAVATNATAAAANATIAQPGGAKAEAPKPADKPAAEEAPPAEEEKPQEPAVEIPGAVKQFMELWNDLYFCRAADIRVQGRVRLLLEKGRKVNELTAEDIETTEKLAKLSQTLVEEFESIKGMKCVEQTQRKTSVIRKKSAELVKQALAQIQRAKAKAERLAKEQAEKLAKEQAAARAAEEHKAKVEEETAKVRARFDSLVSSRLKSLDWEPALKQLRLLQDDLTTAEGKDELRTARMKVERMQGLHQYFISKAKGFKFRNGTVVTAVTAKDISLQRLRSNKKTGKMEPVDRAVTVEWRRFYGKKEYVACMNQLINDLVQKGLEARYVTSKMQWSNHMFGAALTLRLLYAEVEGAAEYAPVLVKKAVKDFEECRKTAARLFPDVELEAAE